MEQHHGVVRGLNVLIPVLAACTILLTLFSAWLQRTWRGQLMLLLLATVFLVAAGLVTRFGNQPINAIVDMWTTAVCWGSRMVSWSAAGLGNIEKAPNAECALISVEMPGHAGQDPSSTQRTR